MCMAAPFKLEIKKEKKFVGIKSIWFWEFVISWLVTVTDTTIPRSVSLSLTTNISFFSFRIFNKILENRAFVLRTERTKLPGVSHNNRAWMNQIVQKYQVKRHISHSDLFVVLGMMAETGSTHLQIAVAFLCAWLLVVASAARNDLNTEASLAKSKCWIGWWVEKPNEEESGARFPKRVLKTSLSHIDQDGPPKPKRSCVPFTSSSCLCGCVCLCVTTWFSYTNIRWNGIGLSHAINASSVSSAFDGPDHISMLKQ